MPVPDGVDPAKAMCIPLAYLAAFQMLTRYRRLLPGATILVIGASGTVGTALLDLARHLRRSRTCAPRGGRVKLGGPKLKQARRRGVG